MLDFRFIAGSLNLRLIAQHLLTVESDFPYSRNRLATRIKYSAPTTIAIEYKLLYVSAWLCEKWTLKYSTIAHMSTFQSLFVLGSICCCHLCRNFCCCCFRMNFEFILVEWIAISRVHFIIPNTCMYENKIWKAHFIVPFIRVWSLVATRNKQLVFNFKFNTLFYNALSLYTVHPVLYSIFLCLSLSFLVLALTLIFFSFWPLETCVCVNFHCKQHRKKCISNRSLRIVRIYSASETKHTVFLLTRRDQTFSFRRHRSVEWI